MKKKNDLVCRVCSYKHTKITTKNKILKYLKIKFIISHLTTIFCKKCNLSTFTEDSDIRYNNAVIKFTKILKKLGLK